MPYATRQKSCDACVRSKRRCDKSYPNCSRCIARHVPCVYQRLPPAAYRQRQPSTLSTTSGLSPLVGSFSSASSYAASAMYTSSAPTTAETTEVTDYTDSSAHVSSVESSRRASQAPSPCPQVSSQTSRSVVDQLQDDLMMKVCDELKHYQEIDEALKLDIDLDMDIDYATPYIPGAETDENAVESMFRNYLPTVPENDSVDDGGYEADIVTWEAPVSASVPLMDMSITTTCDNFPRQPIREQTLQTFQDGHKTCIIHNPSFHLELLTTHLRQIPSFADNHHTMFSHHSLYQDPIAALSLIQDCFACCTLYSTRTSSNIDWVLAFVASRIKSASRSIMAGERTKSCRDKLATTQAMVIYMRMVLFDMDLAKLFDIDELMTSLVKSTETLRESKVKCEGDEEASAVKAAMRPKSWIDWTFRESRRRTIIMSHCIQTYWILRNHGSVSKIIVSWAAGFPYTMSRYLWDAPDAENFFEAWDDLPHAVMRASVLEEGARTTDEIISHSDQDEFSKFMTKIQGSNH